MLALAPLLLALEKPCPSPMRPRSMCVHPKAKTRNQQTSNGRKGCKEYLKRHKTDKHDASKQARRQTSIIASKQAKSQTSKRTNKRWCLWGTSVGLDRMPTTSLCWSIDNTLAGRTHAWTCKQAYGDANKANGGANKHRKHIIAQSEKGSVNMDQPGIWRCIPNDYTQTRTYGHQM